MKRNPIFVKHAGRRVTADKVAWYDFDFREYIDSYFNTGDCAVYDSTLKLIDYNQNQSYALNIDDQEDKTCERILDRFDCIVLRGSNYIHSSMEWGHFASWLERIQLPVICIGVGAQAAQHGRIELSPESRRIWQIISERTPSIGVRGAFSAEVLNDNGIKNAEIVGCPTLFRQKNPLVELDVKPLNSESKVSFSIRRETGEGYTLDPLSFLQSQKRIIEKLADLFDLYLTAHGEVEEKVLYYRDPARMNAVREQLVHEGWFDQEPGILERLYERRLFFSGVVQHMDAFMREMDATIGYRVHGILPAMAQGIPGVLLEYDTRSKELSETLSIPCLSVQEALEMPVEEIFAPERFQRFETEFPKNYARMKAFLDKNGVANRM